MSDLIEKDQMQFLLLDEAYYLNGKFTDRIEVTTTTTTRCLTCHNVSHKWRIAGRLDSRTN